jgi:hypothetical protein
MKFRFQFWMTENSLAKSELEFKPFTGTCAAGALPRVGDTVLVNHKVYKVSDVIRSFNKKGAETDKPVVRLS